MTNSYHSFPSPADGVPQQQHWYLALSPAAGTASGTAPAPGTLRDGSAGRALLGARSEPALTQLFAGALGAVLAQPRQLHGTRGR